MLKKWSLAFCTLLALVLAPTVLQAQNVDPSAPKGSKQNPIKPSSVTAAPSKSKSTKGKRGSKANPITGATHPRGSN
jgi:hypothetical protein